MLERLYPEYVYLCSLAHGDEKTLILRSVLDPRLPMHGNPTSGEIEQCVNSHVDDCMYDSYLNIVQVATEVAALFSTKIDLIVQLTKPGVDSST